jgi:iron complex outermembrane receptor protein
MKNAWLSLAFFGMSLCVSAQETTGISADSIAAPEIVLDEVLVSAVRVNREIPLTFSNLHKEVFQPRNLGQDIPILLNYLPAVVTTSDAGGGVGYTGIRVRGSDATRVNVTINGIPYNDAESHGTFWVNMPDFASSVENLQLQRGVGTSTNGAGAFGASLNLLTDAVSREAYGQIATSAGSFGTYRNNLKFSTGLMDGHFEIAGRLSRITSKGYVDRASSSLDSYFLQAAYVDDKTLVKALLFGGHEITYQSWNGVDAETQERDRTFNSAVMYTGQD